MTIFNLIVHCFLGWKVELSYFRQMHTDLMMELKELGKPPIHIPLITTQFYVHLIGMVSVWATTLFHHRRDPNFNQPVQMEKIKAFSHLNQFECAFATMRVECAFNSL